MVWGRWEITQECRKQQLPGGWRDWASRLRLACKNTFTQNAKKKVATKAKDKRKKSPWRSASELSAWGRMLRAWEWSAQKDMPEKFPAEGLFQGWARPRWLRGPSQLQGWKKEERFPFPRKKRKNTWIRYQPNNLGAFFVISKCPDWENVHCSLVNKAQ